MPTLSQTCNLLMVTSWQSWTDYPKLDTLSQFVRLFKNTRTPLCMTPLLKFPLHSISPWRPTKLPMPADQCGIRWDSFFCLALAIAQRRDLARLTGYDEGEIEIWSWVIATACFRNLAKALSKAVRGKASRWEQDLLAHSLAGLLLLSEISDTFVMGSWGGISQHAIAAAYPGFLERSNHLSLWIRHWIGKFYDDYGPKHPVFITTFIQCLLLLTTDFGELCGKACKTTNR